MALIRSIIHMLWMAITVVPYTLAIVLGSLFGMRGTSLYRIARAWLSLCVHSARPLLGIQYRVTGMEHLPQGEKSGAVLLCKHQSTYETFLMPAIMPHPLAYVFKKELLYVPFFGWSIGRLDMIHIDRSLRAKAASALSKTQVCRSAWASALSSTQRMDWSSSMIQTSSGLGMGISWRSAIVGGRKGHQNFEDSLPRLALAFDQAAVLLHDGLGNGQPQASALGAPGDHGVENRLAQLGADA